MSVITYFSEDISFTLSQKRKISSWIKKVFLQEGYMLSSLNFIFCSDEYLLQINREYLSHDYYTDIITFCHSENTAPIESDIFISIERVTENSQALNTVFLDELYRVMVHGTLHLCGYDDHNEPDIQIMREKENYYLSLI